MKWFCIMVLLCMIFSIFSGFAGCAGSPQGQSSQGQSSQGQSTPQQMVFSNGSIVTNGKWIGIDPIGNQKVSTPFRISGLTNLPEGTMLDVMIMKSGSSADKVKTVDDCLMSGQICVIYFSMITGHKNGINEWNATTDDTVSSYFAGSTRFRAIVMPYMGNVSVREDFSMS